MTNPCKECIVQAICLEGCDKLITFIRENSYLPNEKISFYTIISTNVRRKHIELFWHKKKIRWRKLYLDRNEVEHERESL